MKHILSVSLGSSSRDKTAETEILGEQFLLERRGTDGDLRRFGDTILESDGKVDVITIGGTNVSLHWRDRDYPIRDIVRFTGQVKHTPVVDGTGLKNTLEREMINLLQQRGVVDFRASKVLLVCAVDRFGMAEALMNYCTDYVLGDLMFDVGLPIPLRNMKTLEFLAPLLLPLVTRLPFKWLYPTGAKQDEIVPKWTTYYEWADVVAGDFLIIRHHMPDNLKGKVIITQSTTEKDVTALTERGVRLLVTATPVINGRSFGTNVIEGVFISLMGKPPKECKPEEYLELAAKIGWEPTIRTLNP